jgi:phosphate transport system substrate-binding protein
MKKLVYLSLLLVAAVNVSKAQDNTIMGAGSSFDNPLFSKMFSEYNKKTNVKVNYQSIGSGGGIQQLINKTVDFGASDAPLNDEQAQKIGVPALHIPVTAGAVAISYNLPGVKTQLKLTGDVLAEMFLGNITKWNDAKIMALNKGVNLPDMPIVILHRAEGSGTTNIFTTYLLSASNDWKTKVGRGSAVNWPVGLAAKGTEGVAGLIAQTPGGIGYIELAYAIQNKIAYASIENKNHKYITPSLVSTTAAANVIIPADGKVWLTNTEAKDGYPIASFSWVIIYKEQNYNGHTAAASKQMLTLLWWMIHEGQKFSTALNYAPLPARAVKVGEAILKSATFDGKGII